MMTPAAGVNGKWKAAVRPRNDQWSGFSHGVTLNRVTLPFGADVRSLGARAASESFEPADRCEVVNDSPKQRSKREGAMI